MIIQLQDLCFTLLTSPVKRIESALNSEIHEYSSDYSREPQSLLGLSANWPEARTWFKRRQIRNEKKTIVKEG